MNYMVKVLRGQKYIFALLISLILSACSSTPPATPDRPDFKPTQLATVQISKTETKDKLKQTYGGEVLVFAPKAGFAILGFDGAPKLSTLSTEPNADIASPEASAQGNNAWGGGSAAWASGVNAWGGGTNAWGGGANAWGGGVNAWGGGTNAWGSGTNAWGSGQNAWGSGNTTIPALPSDNRFMFQQIRLPQAHTVSRNFGAGVKIAVIDTGIDLAHPLFTGRLAPASDWWDYVDNDPNPQEVAGSFYGHGTGIAGLIVQVAPRATILPIRVLGPDGVGDVANIVMAIDRAVQKGANVINLSLGTDQDVASLKQAVEYAAQMGIYVVAAAGNEGNSSQLLYPAQYMISGEDEYNMLSVGSFSADLLMSTFCNRGIALEYVAPGEMLLSSYPDMRVAKYTGSSFATPVVAGAIALAQGDADEFSAAWVDYYLYISSNSFDSSQARKIDITNLLRSIPGFIERKALMVTGSTTLVSADSNFKSKLEGLGYKVSVKDHSSVSSSDASGKDVVFISPSVDPAKLGTKLRDVATPVVTSKDSLFDDMKLTGTSSGSDFGAQTGQKYLSIKTTHPIASGFSTLLPSNVFSVSSDLAWGKPSSNATIIASVPNDASKAVLFAYNKGASMKGINAPARRVGFYNAKTTTAYTSWGWQLFESAITWATSGN